MITIELLIAMGCIFGLGSIYAIYNYINDRIEHNYIRIHERSNKITNNFNDRLALLEQKLKDGLQNNSSCCKSGMERLKQDIQEIHKLESRLRRCEVKLFSKESTNEIGERVISVSVPLLKDVPLATVPLGGSGDHSSQEADFKPKLVPLKDKIKEKK